MFAKFAEVLAKLVDRLGFADVLDILVMSVFCYAVISWLLRSQSRFVMRGFVGLAALYFVARLLGMQLTLFVFQAVLTFALVALVVIFQEDIRRAFERLALRARLDMRRSEGPEDALVQTVLRAVSRLARERTGALLVFKGQEPLERHLSGGISLQGQVSEPLLYSIFDPSSAGHDGAVVLDGALVERFGVHLPLATTGEAARLGTRHTAALGLAQRSDALVVVVSEERGTVSVAHNGELRLVEGSELRQALRRLQQRVRPPSLRLAGGALRRTALRLLAVALATLAWAVLVVAQSESVEQTFTVPVIYGNVPEDWMLDEPEPTSVRVTVAGPEAVLQQLDAEKLRAQVDVSHVESGKQDVAIDSGALELPRQLSVQRLEPRTISVVARRTVVVRLPVKAQIAGRVPRGMLLQELDVVPDRVPVLVPEADRQRSRVLKTEPVNLSEFDRTSTVTRRVVLPEGVYTREGAALTVSVTAVLARVSSAPRPASSVPPDSAPPR